MLASLLRVIFTNGSLISTLLLPMISWKALFSEGFWWSRYLPSFQLGGFQDISGERFPSSLQT